MKPPGEPTFFETPAAFRDWLEEHGEHEKELYVGLRKKGSGIPSMTYAEAVDAALCYGWIDGITRRLDETSYMLRFTPRQKRSNWSAVNIRRVGELIDQGLMRPPGLRAFEARTEDRSQIYSYEQRDEARFDAAQEATFRANAEAWSWWERQPPGYRRTATYWVATAKREETRARRLAQLIDDSAAGRRIAALTSPTRKTE